VHEGVLLGPDIDQILLKVRPTDPRIGVEVDCQGAEVQGADAAGVDD
jgi:hypothetical protein